MYYISLNPTMGEIWGGMNFNQNNVQRNTYVTATVCGYSDFEWVHAAIELPMFLWCTHIMQFYYFLLP